MSNPLIFGVDVGLSGAIACMDVHRRVAAVRLMPVAGKLVDVAELGAWVRVMLVDEKEAEGAIAYIEEAGPRPAQGRVSVFTFAAAYGAVLGVFGALEIPVQKVPPKAWKKVVLAGTAKDKVAAIVHCRQRYPLVPLIVSKRGVKPHDGIADAICIAEYGVRDTRGSNRHPLTIDADSDLPVGA